ncbi:O-antigen ligase family protein [Pseudomonadota bacterium]
MMLNQRVQQVKSHIHAYIPYGYGMFMAGFFFIPNAVDQYKFFSVAVFVPLLFIARDLLVPMKRNTLWMLTAAYLAWMLTTSFWSADFSWLEFFKTFRLALYILAFILLTAYLQTTKPEMFRKILVTICFSAGVAALISIPIWYTQHTFPDSSLLGIGYPDSRLVGIGTLENTNTSSYLYGLHALFSIYLGLHSGKRPLKLLLYINSVILLCFVFLTQSKTGILASTGTIAILLLAGKHFNNTALKVVGTLTLAFTLLFLSYSMGMLNKPLDHGMSTRMVIWQAVLVRIQEAPIIGNGYQKPPRSNPNDNLEPPYYTHNTLLGTLRDGGLIGGLLYVWILFYAGHIGIKAYRDTGDPFYLACLLFGVTCMLTDTDEVITRPRELWIIFWLPLAILIARNSQRANSRSTNPSAL